MHRSTDGPVSPPSRRWSGAVGVGTTGAGNSGARNSAAGNSGARRGGGGLAVLALASLLLAGCAAKTVDPSLAERVRPEAIARADDALAWPGSASAPRVTLTREDTCTSAEPSGWFTEPSGTRCSQQGRVVYALLGATTPDQALTAAARVLRDSNVSPVNPFVEGDAPSSLGDPSTGVVTTHPASKAYGSDETTITLATAEELSDRGYPRATDVVVASTPGLEGDDLTTAVRATGACYVLEIQYAAEYFDSRFRGSDQGPRDGPRPCFGTSGDCPGG